ncbi:hypothetical protein [Cellulomonas gelida]|nr:hypothetical protein [Cellulomonas gelida]
MTTLPARCVFFTDTSGVPLRSHTIESTPPSPRPVRTATVLPANE